MKLGFVSDSLGSQSFTDLLDSAVTLGVQGLEINTGGWSTAPHFDLAEMKGSARKRKDFLATFEECGLEVISLNANGNPLHPVSGDIQSSCLEDTVRVAGEMGLKKVCCMSGQPAGGPGDRTPNWIVSSWPPETQKILEWQWQEVLIPYWQKLTTLAKDCGVERFALELHGGQLVYNVPSLLKLRQALNDVGACGSMVGANLDPSHLFWMGADPLVAVDCLGAAVFHVHAKDTLINPRVQASSSLLENGDLSDIANRSWHYVTLGYGHGEAWWRQFCYHLLKSGYQDGWLSIEHEDMMLNSYEGLDKSVRLLQQVMPTQPSDYVPQAV